MKKHFLKIFTLLVFASVAISSCSVQYRERRHTRVEHRNNDYHDDHHYDQMHR